MTEEVKFTCPMCGKEWIEEQDTKDDWFRLGTKQTLCAECSNREIKKVKHEWMIERQRCIECKDCKHQYEYRTGSCPYYTTYGSVPPDDWYCADGVRK